MKDIKVEQARIRIDADDRAAERERYWRWHRERSRRETPAQRERREGREHDIAIWEGEPE